MPGAAASGPLSWRSADPAATPVEDTRTTTLGSCAELRIQDATHLISEAASPKHASRAASSFVHIHYELQTLSSLSESVRRGPRQVLSPPAGILHGALQAIAHQRRAKHQLGSSGTRSALANGGARRDLLGPRRSGGHKALLQTGASAGA